MALFIFCNYDERSFRFRSKLVCPGAAVPKVAIDNAGDKSFVWHVLINLKIDDSVGADLAKLRMAVGLARDLNTLYIVSPRRGRFNVAETRR